MLALCLVLCLTVSLFAGCSGKTAATQTAEPAKATEAPEVTAEPAPEPTAEHAPEPVELIVFSAAPKQMNQPDASKDKDANLDGLDLVLQGTRVDNLENKVALAVPEGNPANIDSYDDLVAGLKAGTILLAMGDSDVPVGQYTQKILKYFELNEEELAKACVITYGSNVKQVTIQVFEAAVSCGIIYGTDAYSAKLTGVDTATKEMCGQVIYPAAVLNVTKNEAEARAFLNYLTGPEASAVFESVGFSPLS